MKKKRAGETVEMKDVPILADYDKSRWLVKNAFPYLDPVMRVQQGKKRYLFWGILGYYRAFSCSFLRTPLTRVTHSAALFATQFILLSIQVINDFAAPVATLRLLAYLESTRSGENEGGDSSGSLAEGGFLVRPWVWIIWLALGPVWAAFAQQLMFYLLVRLMYSLFLPPFLFSLLLAGISPPHFYLFSQ